MRFLCFNRLVDMINAIGITTSVFLRYLSYSLRHIQLRMRQIASTCYDLRYPVSMNLDYLVRIHAC